jgi:lipopolysaccharide export system permease protein
MRLSATLSLYLGRHFLVWVTATFVALVFVVFLFELIELLRRGSSRQNQDVAVWLLVQMALFKLPNMAQVILPFAVLFGGMMSFWRLTRSNELVVARAAGVSVWQFLLPALVVAALIGGIKLTVFNPFASVLAARFEQLESKFLRGRGNALAVSPSGLWLRQGQDDGQSVLRAGRVLNEQLDLEDVLVLVFDNAGKFRYRIDARQAHLDTGRWVLGEAWIAEPGKPARFAADHSIPTDLTIAKIQDSFASPETMSFWDLYGFIAVLERAGFSASRHRLYWHSLLAGPLLLCSMVLLAAVFSLRSSRRGGTAMVIGAGVIFAFGLYFLSDLIFALALSSRVPVVLAAWAPGAVTALLGIASLLHQEDG